MSWLLDWKVWVIGLHSTIVMIDDDDVMMALLQQAQAACFLEGGEQQ